MARALGDDLQSRVWKASVEGASARSGAARFSVRYRVRSAGSRGEIASCLPTSPTADVAASFIHAPFSGAVFAIRSVVEVQCSLQTRTAHDRTGLPTGRAIQYHILVKAIGSLIQHPEEIRSGRR